MVRSVRAAHPPLWVACSNRDTIKLAARLGIGALTFAFVDPSEAKYWVEEYYTTFKNECEPIGRSVNPNVAMVTGFMCHEDSEEALRRGIQVETHAIGDRANRTILDLYENAFKSVPAEQRKVRDPRWRVEHAQIVDLADIPRFARLGVIPSMQPSHALSDLFFAPSRLGMDRLAGAYAWQSFIKSGSIIPGGSDAPVERGEPMIEFYAAVARKDLKGYSGAGWHPEEALTREQAIKMFTIWAAYAAFEEELRGSIETGKLADFTILSADIMKIPEAEILKTRCLATIIGGEIVYESKQQGPD